MTRSNIYLIDKYRKRGFELPDIGWSVCGPAISKIKNREGWGCRLPELLMFDLPDDPTQF
jgi:hypothetical protein